MPVAMALSPDRTLLVVAAKGGTFSLLPISKSGDLAEITAVHKELGTPASSQIRHMRFIGPESLLVHDVLSVRTYACRSGGMRLATITDVDHDAASHEFERFPGQTSLVERELS